MLQYRLSDKDGNGIFAIAQYSMSDLHVRYQSIRNGCAFETVITRYCSHKSLATTVDIYLVLMLTNTFSRACAASAAGCFAFSCSASSLLLLGRASAALQMLDQRLRLECAAAELTCIQRQLAEEAGHLAIVGLHAISISRERLTGCCWS